MCCIITTLALLGPRFAIIVWWIANPGRWDRAFDTVLWPILGFLVLPWTTLAYVAVQPQGVEGFDWFVIAIAVLADVVMWSGGGYGNRQRVPGYSSS